MDIKISVIVPVYNVSEYINRCLISLINQTLKDLEIIVIDDCGSDDSIDKVLSLQQIDNRIKIIKNERNKGLAESRNIAISHSHGKYIAFLDSDDFVEDNYYEKLYQLAENSGADIAYSNVAFYYNDQDIQYHGWFEDRLFNGGKTLLQTPKDRMNTIRACCCWNKIYKRTFLEKYKLGFPKDLFLEDIPFTFACSILANKLVGDPNINLLYRQRDTGIMSQISQNKRCFDIFKVLSICDSLIQKHSNELFNNCSTYKQILEAFKVEQVVNWYYRIPIEYKNEFHSCARKLLLPMKLQENTFLHSKVLSEYRKLFYRRIFKIKLFNKIVLFTKISTQLEKGFRIFNIQIVDRIKNISKTHKTIRLFKYIPLLEVIRTSKTHKTIRLFKYIPLLEIIRTPTEHYIYILKCKVYKKVKKHQQKIGEVSKSKFCGIFKLVKKEF